MRNNSNKPVILLGAGGHAKVLLDVLRLEQQVLLGLVTPDLEKGSKHLGLEVLGDDEILKKYNHSDIELVNGIGSLPFQKLRWSVSDKVRSWGFTLSKVIHPSAIISADVMLDEGVQVMTGCVIQPGCSIGRDTIINTGSTIDHDCEIGGNTHIAPGCVLSGGVNVGESAHIGTGSRIIQDIKVGEGAVVAAGTTLYKDVEAGMLIKQPNTLQQKRIEV
jgi:sugar O-acyltransferase (sialic acid O-acetyltransferase NeuD family)